MTRFCIYREKLQISIKRYLAYSNWEVLMKAVCTINLFSYSLYILFVFPHTKFATYISPQTFSGNPGCKIYCRCFPRTQYTKSSTGRTLITPSLYQIPYYVPYYNTVIQQKERWVYCTIRLPKLQEHYCTTSALFACSYTILLLENLHIWSFTMFSQVAFKLAWVLHYGKNIFLPKA